MTTQSWTNEIHVHYECHIVYTRKLFALDNFAFQKAIESFSSSGRCIFMLDGGFAGHWPTLAQDIQKYCDKNLKRGSDISFWPSGESCKSEEHLNRVMKFFAEKHVERKDVIVAIGGGAFLDLIGYASTICHRGVQHVRIPTTTLSQADSGVGVKNGINAFQQKNFLGTFAPPLAVLCDFDHLETLSARDFCAGIAEAVKVALIKDAAFFDWIELNALALHRRDPVATEYLVTTCARLHSSHITQAGDPFERASKRPLDFGHWAAHKLELLTHHELRHGEAVSIGMVLDSTYSYLEHDLPLSSLKRLMSTLMRLGLPIRCDLNFEQKSQLLNGLEEFRQHLGGKLDITLLHDIGSPFQSSEVCRETMNRAAEFIDEFVGREKCAPTHIN